MTTRPKIDPASERTIAADCATDAGSPTECLHGLEPAWCSLCLDGPTTAPPAAELKRVITARYDGECPTCRLPIVVGEWTDDQWRHAECRPSRWDGAGG